MPPSKCHCMALRCYNMSDSLAATLQREGEPAPYLPEVQFTSEALHFFQSQAGRETERFMTKLGEGYKKPRR